MLAALPPISHNSILPKVPTQHATRGSTRSSVSLYDGNGRRGIKRLWILISCMCTRKDSLLTHFIRAQAPKKTNRFDHTNIYLQHQMCTGTWYKVLHIWVLFFPAYFTWFSRLPCAFLSCRSSKISDSYTAGSRESKCHLNNIITVTLCSQMCDYPPLFLI